MRRAPTGPGPMHLLSLLLAVPLLGRASSLPYLSRRDDPSEGGGEPNSDGQNGLSNWVGKPGKAAAPPHEDNFYKRAPDNLARYANGAVVGKRSISLAGTYSGIADAVELRVRSEDAHDEPALTVATVLTPSQAGSRRAGTVPVIVYQVSEDSASFDCAPTYQLFARAIPQIQALLSNGFVVVVPDYEGQRASYTVGKLGGKQVLDAARAAISLPDVKHANETASVGLWGYGTGAYTSAFAAELAPVYAPDVPLNGVAVGGTVTNLLNWLDSMNSSPNSGLVVSSLLGMASQYRDVSDALANNVVPHRRSQFESASSRCVLQNALHYFETNITSQYFTPGVDVLGLPAVKQVYGYNSLGQTAPRAPIYAYHGGDDELASATDLRNVLQNYCHRGTTVRYSEITGASHSQAAAQSDEIIDFLASSLAGISPISSCSLLGQI